jgi:hypothetical protein
LLVVYHAEPHSASARALALLSSIATRPSGRQPRPSAPSPGPARSGPTAV